MEAREVKKLYYSIGEISEKTGLKQYVLRYWETEFSHIKPSKNSAGNRVYKESDYQNILELKELLHQKKFTIKGAKQFLTTKHSSRNVSNSNENIKMLKLIDTLDIKTLKNIQKSLGDLLLILEGKPK